RNEKRTADVAPGSCGSLVSASIRPRGLRWVHKGRISQILTKLKRSICGASCRRRFRILDFDPGFRWTRAIGRIWFLGNNSLKSKFANSFEHFPAVALGMFNKLNPASCALQDFSQGLLSFGKRFSPQVFAIDRQQVESECDCSTVIDPAMQGVEVGHTI